MCIGLCEDADEDGVKLECLCGTSSDTRGTCRLLFFMYAHVAGEQLPNIGLLDCRMVFRSLHCSNTIHYHPLCTTIPSHPSSNSEPHKQRVYISTENASTLLGSGTESFPWNSADNIAENNTLPTSTQENPTVVVEKPTKTLISIRAHISVCSTSNTISFVSDNADHITPPEIMQSASFKLMGATFLPFAVL